MPVKPRLFLKEFRKSLDQKFPDPVKKSEVPENERDIKSGSTARDIKTGSQARSQLQNADQTSNIKEKVIN